MNSKTQGRSKGSIVLYVFLDLHPRSLVHLLENKRFHWVNVNKRLHKIMIGIWEYRWSQWLAEVFHLFSHLEDLLPHFSQHNYLFLDSKLAIDEIKFVELVDLGLNYSIQYLFWRWKHREGSIKILDDHFFPWFKPFIIHFEAPIPSKPLKILCIN